MTKSAEASTDVIGSGAHPRSEPPRGVRSGILLAATWLGGVSGAVLAIEGIGPVVMGPADQTTGERWILAITGAWLLIATIAHGRVRVTTISAIGALVVTPLVTAPTVGRAPGLIAMSSVIVLYGILVEWRPVEGWPPRRLTVAWAALVPFVAAQVAWVLGIGFLPTAALLAAAVLVMEAYHRSSSRVEHLHAYLRSTRSWLAGLVGRLVGPWREPARLLGTEDDRRTAMWAYGLAFLLGATLMFPIYQRYVYEPAEVTNSADYGLHLELADDTEVMPPRFSTPHPLFHYSVAVGGSIVSTKASAVAVLAFFGGLTSMAILWLCRVTLAGSRQLSLAAGVAAGVLYILAETPGVLTQALRIGNSFDWAPALHMNLSPTEGVLIPLALVMLMLVGRSLDTTGELTTRDGALIALTAALSTLAKPSMAIALIPAIGCWGVFHWQIAWRRAAFLTAWMLVPAGVIVLWQTWFLETGANDLPEAGIAVRPFDTIRSVNLDKAGLVSLFPLVIVALCCWIGARKFFGDPTIALSSISLVIALVYMALLTETGERSQDGTFTKPAFMCMSILMLLSWRFLAGEFRDQLALPASERRRAWMVATAACAAIMGVSGVVAYLNEVGLMDLALRGSAA